MGARSGGRAASAWVGLLVALLLVSVGFVPVVAIGEAEEQQEELEEVLYFTQRRGGDPEYNFTTYAPTTQGATVREGAAGGGLGLEVSWGWRIPTAPANWSIESGDTWDVVLYLSGWDEHLPLANPISNPDAIGQHRVQANLTLGTLLIASGAIYRDADPLNDGVERVMIPIEFADSFDLRSDATSGTILLNIFITGRRTSIDATMDLHFGSTEFPSKIEAPGYPVEEFRIWEDRFLWDQHCKEQQLEQEKCDEQYNGPPPTNGGPENRNPPGNSTEEEETEPAPLPLLILAIALGFILLIAFVRRHHQN